jgi:hypothetical protein
MKRKPARSSKKTKTSRRTKTTITRKPKLADFEDEDAVLREVAKALGEDPADLKIRRGSAPNGYGDAYEITSGREEYFVMEDQDEFETAARNGVERDLADEPEMFDRNFVEGHINLDKLRDELMSDVTDSSLDSLQDEADRHPIQFMKDHDIDIDPPSDKQVKEWADAMDKSVEEIRSQDAEDQWSEIGEDPTVDSSAIEAVAEEQAKEQLRDPMDYLRDIYGEDAAKKAIEIAGIDYKAAADEAVRVDGAEHFMCSYDGDYQTTPSGFILWRHN